MVDKNYDYNLEIEPSREVIESVINEGIATSDIWSQHEERPESDIFYNTPTDRLRLIESVAQSQDPARALAYIRGWLNFPYDESQAYPIGSMKILAVSRTVRLLDSFNPSWIKIDPEVRSPMYTTIPSPEDYIKNLELLPSTTAFFSRKSNLNKFNIPMSYFVIAANQYLADFIQSAYVSGWEDKDGTNIGYMLPTIILPTSSFGLNDGMDVHNFKAAIRAADRADMELGYWKLLQLVLQPKSKDAGNLIGGLDEYVQHQIDIRNTD